ncbi:MAG: Vgb family protein [Vulcanimicrobiaceae bacterium]
MSLRTLALFAIVLMLASCGHSSTLPATPLAPDASGLTPNASDLLAARLRWQFFDVRGSFGSLLAKDKSYNTWFFIASNSIAKIDKSGKVTTYPIPFQNFGFDITYGNDGDIWFTSGPKIGRVSPRGSISSYPTTGFAEFLTPGFGADIWYTDSVQRLIVRMTYDGTTTKYHLPTAFPNPIPHGITRGPDGNIWFETETGLFHQYTTSKLNPTTGAITEYALPQGVNGGDYIIAGTDKRLWRAGATEPFNAPLLDATDTNGVTTTYPLPHNAGGPLAVGQDGALYIGAVMGPPNLPTGGIMRVTTGGQVTTYTTSGLACCPIGIAAGPDGDIWFSDQSEIGVAHHIAHQ